MIELKHAEDYGLAEPYTTTRNPARFLKYLIMEVVNGGRMTECHLICSEGFSFQTEAQWIRCIRGLKKLPGFSSPAVQTNALHQGFCISAVNSCIE